jgi:hypothetical protein
MMSKTIKAFKEGDSVPPGGTFLYKETIKTNVSCDCDGSCHGLMPCNCYSYQLITYFYYEVPEEIK